MHRLAGSLALLAAAAASAAEPAPARRAQLVELVRQDCGSCHGLTLKGGLGPSLEPAAMADKDAAQLELRHPPRPARHADAAVARPSSPRTRRAGSSRPSSRVCRNEEMFTGCSLARRSRPVQRLLCEERATSAWWSSAPRAASCWSRRPSAPRSAASPGWATCRTPRSSSRATRATRTCSGATAASPRSTSSPRASSGA